MKRAIVTGSTKGIGKEIGMELLSHDCEVVFHFKQDTKSAAQLEEQLHAKGYTGHYQIIQADLSSMAGLAAFQQQIEPRFHELDYLILNAGTTWRGSLSSLTYEHWEQVLHTNLTIPLFLTQQCASWMQSGGCVLFIGSIMGSYPHTLSHPYGVSKAGVHYLTRSLVKEFAPQNVRVNCLSPGFTDTEWQKKKPEEIRASIESKTALHRFADPEEISHMAYSILENPYMNGSVVNIDGGYCYQ